MGPTGESHSGDGYGYCAAFLVALDGKYLMIRSIRCIFRITAIAASSLFVFTFAARAACVIAEFASIILRIRAYPQYKGYRARTRQLRVYVETSPTNGDEATDRHACGMSEVRITNTRSSDHGSPSRPAAVATSSVPDPRAIRGDGSSVISAGRSSSSLPPTCPIHR